jgi:hypothetical protein
VPGEVRSQDVAITCRESSDRDRQLREELARRGLLGGIACLVRRDARHVDAPLCPTSSVRCLVLQDPDQPWHQRTTLVVLSRALHRRQERGLDQVFGFASIASEVACDAQE